MLKWNDVFRSGPGGESRIRIYQCPRCHEVQGVTRWLTANEAEPICGGCMDKDGESVQLLAVPFAPGQPIPGGSHGDCCG